MEGEHVVERDRLCGECQLDRRFHGGDVAEHLDGDAVRDIATFGKCYLGLEQTSWPDL